MKTKALTLRRFARLGLYAFAISAALFFLAPLYVVLCTAFKSPAQLRGASLLALPMAPNWLAFSRAWSHACTGLACDGIGGGFWNSLEITLPAVVLSVSLGAVNGFALSMWRLRGAGILLGLLLIGAFIPYQIILYPLVKLVAAAGLFGSLPGVIGVHVIFSLPILTLLFRNFYASLPPEIVDAARIDGGSFWSIFWHVIRPLSSGMIAVAVILQFTGVWNDYLFGLIFAGREHLPMTVQLNNLVDRTYAENDYSVDMAATVLTALPPLLVYLLSGRYFVRGVTAGAVKG
jgi:glucose/mannose transport system permease protein